MAKRRPIDPDELDEGPSDADLERFSDVTQKCPECGAELHDDVEMCWKCGHALMSRPTHNPRSLIIVLIVVMLLLMVLVFSRVW